MSFQALLDKTVDKNDSLLCIGLDPASGRLPAHIKSGDALSEFNKQIIDQTYELVCAYKPNTAFYEAQGVAGITQLKQTCDYIRQTGVPLIVDAKRGDIGSTNEGYAAFIFDYLGADAVTLSPYLGREALQTFLGRRDKGIIILCRTSNPGAGEFQDAELKSGQKLYELVASRVKDEWNSRGNCLLVVGATYPDELGQLRQELGQEMTFLVPGIGAQGGDLRATLKAGLNSRARGLVINSGRDIIYAGDGPDFAQKARAAAQRLRQEINKYREGGD